MLEIMKKMILWGVDPKYIGILERVADVYNDLPNSDFHKHLALGLVGGYCLRYKQNEYEEIRPEIKLSTMIDDVELGCRADSLVKKEGKWWLQETKTTSEDSKEKFLARMMMDYQPTLEVYVFEKNNYHTEGVVYDVLKKPRIRQGKIESEQRFNERMIKTLLEDAMEPESKYFYREEIYKTPADLQEFEDNFRMMTKDLKNHMKEGLWYQDRVRCFDYGKECAFMPICQESDPVAKEGIIRELFKKKEFKRPAVT